MKLQSILLVLLGCLFGSINASTSSSDDTALPMDTPDPSDPFAAAFPTGLWENRMCRPFFAEFALELTAMASTFVLLITGIGCDSPELLSAALIVTAFLYTMKAAILIARTEIIRHSASTAAGPVRITPTSQLAFSSMLGIADCGRAVALLCAAIQRHYCEIGSHTTATSIFETLLVAMMMGMIQMALSYGNMLVWVRDLTDPLPSEALLQ